MDIQKPYYFWSPDLTLSLSSEKKRKQVCVSWTISDLRVAHGTEMQPCS